MPTLHSLATASVLRPFAMPKTRFVYQKIKPALCIVVGMRTEVIMDSYSARSLRDLLRPAGRPIITMPARILARYKGGI